MPLTPLYRQGTPLTPLAFRLDAVNTVIPKKNLFLQKIWFSHSMKNEKLMVNHLIDKRLRSFYSIFPRKCGRTAEDWSLGLNVEALVVSLNLPWPSKFTKKNWSFYDSTSWSLAEILTVLTWRPLSKNFSLFLLSYKVHLHLLPSRFSGSFVLFSNAKREGFEFLVWTFQTVNRLNPCFRKDLDFLYFFCNGGALDLLRHVVGLSESLTISGPAETT